MSARVARRPLLLLALGAFGGAACTPKDADKAPPVTAVSDAATSAAAPPVEPAEARPPKPTNVLLLSIDCLRADMPWAGYPRPIAPRLTEFARGAVDYTQAYALSSYTSMSVGGMLSGRYPGELKRDGYFFGTYAKDNLFFPELLQSAGVFTAAAHAHGYFAKSGLEQGFDRWELVPDLKWNNKTDENVTSKELLAIAERMLSEPRASKGPFFAWFHFLDPHDRYVPHDKDKDEEPIFWGKTLRDRYDAEVTYTDRYVGRLLDFVAKQPWAKETAIVLTADHGEAFGEHGQYAHGFELWQNLVRIPLLIAVPGAAPRKIDTPRSTLDLAPTILELLQVPAPPEMTGKSLLGEVRGAPAEARDVMIDLPATSDNDRRRALIHGDLKVIGSGANDLVQVYDLKADPEEKAPIRGTDASKEIVAIYKERQKSITDVPPTKCKEDCLNGAYRRKEKSP